jgi:hypothetical protein
MTADAPLDEAGINGTRPEGTETRANVMLGALGQKRSFSPVHWRGRAAQRDALLDWNATRAGSLQHERGINARPT